MRTRMHTAVPATMLLAMLLGACAGNLSSPDTRSEHDCRSGEVLVCKGSSANSRIKDSKLNELDICTCRQVEP